MHTQETREQPRTGRLPPPRDRTFYDALGREILDCLRSARNAAAEKDRHWW